MARNLFKLVGEISVKGIKDLQKGLTELDKKAVRLGRQIDRTGKKMSRMGATLTKNVTLPLLAAGAAAIKFGADFEKAMTSSLAIMGDVTDAMKNDMSKAAREVGKTTKFSATEAAKAYFFLASAGLSAAQAIKALPKVAAFAQAGQFDLSLATDLLTDAQSALGLVVKDVAKNMENMGRVSDVLVKANTLANASVQQFSEALTNKAGAALRVLGKDIEEGVAILAVYADQGVKAADAGTQLNIVLRDLQVATIKNSKAWERAGVAVFDAQGEMRSIADIIGQLEDRLEGMSDKEKRVELATLGFTSKSIAATMALLGTSDAIKDYEKNLRSAGGITDEVAKKQLQNFWDQLNLVKSEMIDVGLTIWQSLEPVLTNRLIPALKKVAAFVKGVADWFNKLSPEIQETTILIVALVAAAGPLLLIVGKLTSAFALLAPAIIASNAALLANPYVAAAAAIGALVFAIIKLDKASKESDATVQRAVDIIEETKALKKLRWEQESLVARLTHLKDTGKWYDAGALQDAINNVATINEQLGASKKIIEETPDPVTGDKKGGGGKKGSGDGGAAAKIAWSKKLIQQRIEQTNNLRIQLKKQLELIGIEEQEEKDNAAKTGADIADIKKFYAKKRIQVEEEYFTAVKALEDQSLVDKQIIADRMQEIDEARSDAKWEQFRKDERREQELHEQNMARFELLAAATLRFNESLSQIIDNMFQKKFNVMAVNEQKEIDAVNKSVLNEKQKEQKIAAIKLKFEKQAARLRKEQAKKDKAFAIFGSIINTALGITNALKMENTFLGIAMAVIVGILGAVQIAAIASEPLPLARGGFAKAGMGGVLAQVGEGREDEIILPMKTGVQVLADALIEKFSAIEFPKPATQSVGFAGAGGGAGSVGGRGNDVHLHIGTLIANDEGLKQLEQTLLPFRVENEMRKGRKT